MQIFDGLFQSNCRCHLTFSVDEILEPGTDVKCRPKPSPNHTVANLSNKADAIATVVHQPRTAVQMQVKWGWLMKFIKDHDLENNNFESSILFYLMNLWSLGYKKSTVRDHFNCICRKLRMMDKYDYSSKSNNIKHFFLGLDNIFRKESPKHLFTTAIVEQLCDQVLLSSKFPMYDKKLYIAMFIIAFHGLLCRGEMCIRKLGDPYKIDVQDVYKFPLNGSFNLVIRNAKTAKSGKMQTVIVTWQANQKYDPYTCLQEYMESRLQVTGPLFIQANGNPVTTHHFSHRIEQFVRVTDCRTIPSVWDPFFQCRG